MRSGMLSRLLSVVAMTGIVAFAEPGASFASPPDNDLFDNASTIPLPLPYTDSGNLAGTSTEFGEPLFTNCNGFPPQQTVWYKFNSASPKAISVDLNGSDPGVVLYVWQSFGPGLDSLFYFGCTSVGNSFKVTTQPGITYYVQAGTTFGGSAQLQLNIQEIPPPANDAFANAKVIDTRPFVDPVDLTAATTEAGEPTPSQAFTPIAGSAWYSFTPDVTETVMARVSSCCVPPILAVYTGGASTRSPR